MKKIIKLLFIVIAMAVITPTFTSCKEDEEEEENELLNPIIGTWECESFEDLYQRFTFNSDGSFLSENIFWCKTHKTWETNSMTGLYIIANNILLITYSTGNTDAHVFSVSENTITIDNTKYLRK